MIGRLRNLPRDIVERLREIEATISTLEQERAALIRPLRQSLDERNRAIADRLAAGEPVAALCAEFQLTRARVHEIASKMRIRAKRSCGQAAGTVRAA